MNWLYRILVIAPLCGAFLWAPAHAQKTKDQLNTEVSTTFPDNTVGAITPSGVRTFQTDLINSIMPTAPVVSGNLACFNGTTGLLQDCGYAPNSLVVGTSTIFSGTPNGILFNNSTGKLGNTNAAPGAFLNTDSSSNPSLTATPTLGVAGSVVGSISLANATSGTVTIQPATGALGAAVASLPSGSYTVVGDGLSQTLTNKTLTSPVIATIVNTGTLTLPTSTDTLVGRATTDTLSNKTIDTAAPNTIKVNGNTLSASAGTATLTLPNSTDTLIGRATTDTLTNKTIAGASNTLTVLAGSQLSGQVPLGNGGTGQATAATARASSGLNVDSFTGHGDSIYTILATDRTVGTNAAFTASRTWTLPAANAVNPGQEIVVADFQGTVTGTNTLVISRAGADTVNGGTSVTIVAANGAYLFKSDGTSKWTAQALGAAAAGGVSSVTCGTGLSGGTIITNGTCALALTNATRQASPTNPTGTTSVSAVMMGMGATCSITPVYSGRINVLFSGSSQNNTSAAVNSIQVLYGTGTAPVNGAVGTGTLIGPARQTAQSGTVLLMPFAVGGIVTGLSPGTTYWIDLSLATSSGTANVQGIGCSAFEF